MREGQSLSRKELGLPEVGLGAARREKAAEPQKEQTEEKGLTPPPL